MSVAPQRQSMEKGAGRRAVPAWRAHELSVRRGRSSRLVGLSVALVLLSGLIGALGFLLFRPCLHPNAHGPSWSAHLAAASLGHAIAPAPASPGAGRDFKALQALTGVLYRGPQGSSMLRGGDWRSASELPLLGAQLEDIATNRPDVVLMYVTAQGVSDDETAYLRWNFAVENGTDRIRWRDLLKQVTASPAETTVLIVDAGHLTNDPGHGLALNAFSQLALREVEQTGDRRLWCLISHSELEQSHSSHALQRSIFGYFVTEGLCGAADLDNDRFIELGELHRFVATNVAETVNQLTGGQGTQLPRLAWGGGPEPTPRDYPMLVPISTPDLIQVALNGAPTPAAFRGRSIQIADNSDQPPGKAQRLSVKATPAAPATGAGAEPITAGKPNMGDVAAPPGTPGSLPPAAVSAATVPATAGSPSPTSTAASAAPPATASGTGPAPAPTTANSPPPSPMAAAPAAGSRPNPPGGGSQADAAPAGKSDVLDALEQAWQFHDELAACAAYRHCVTEELPHWWQAFEARLLGLEQRLRAADSDGQKLLLIDLQQLLDDARLVAQKLGDTTWGGPALRPNSLAMAQLLSQFCGTPLPETVKALISQLDQLIATGTDASYRDWLATLSPEHEQYAEIRLARQLSRIDNPDWNVLQAAMANRRQAEQTAAAALGHVSWLTQSILEADRYRLNGERLLLDQIDADRERRAIELFRRSRELYEIAENTAKFLRLTEQLQHELLIRAREYVQWRMGGEAERAAYVPAFDDLGLLLETLAETARRSELRDPKDLHILRESHARMEFLKGLVDAPVQPRVVASLGTSRPLDGASRTIEVLLATPLPPAPFRMELLRAAAPIDRELVERIRLPELQMIHSPRPAASADWPLALHRMQLQVQLTQLADLAPPESPEEATTLDELHRKLPQLFAALREGDTGTEIDAEFWATAQRVGTELGLFYRTLPGRVRRAAETPAAAGGPEEISRRMGRVLAARRALTQIDPRHDELGVEAQLPTTLSQAAVFELWAWQRARLLASRDNASRDERQYLQNWAEVCRDDASRIPNQPMLPVTPPRVLDVSGPERLALEHRMSSELRISVANISHDATQLWTVLQYDPQLLEVTGSPDLVLYHQPQLRAKAATQGESGILAVLRDRPPTLHLARGRSDEIPLRVRARGFRNRPTLLVVRTLSEHESLRHETVIELPFPDSIQLGVRGIANTWSPETRGLRLFPFPNRTTEFSLELSSAVADDRLVNLRLFTPPAAGLPVPAQMLNGSDTAQLLKKLGLGDPVLDLPGIKLPAGGTIPVPFANPPPAPAAGALPQPEIPLETGLIVALTDTVSGHTSFRRIEAAPQHPRRYIQPRVDYNNQRERVEITLRLVDPLVRPATGISVHCELVDLRAANSLIKLDDELIAAETECRLAIPVGSSPQGFVDLALSVDGYPRAFLYRVPCDGEQVDVAENTDVLAARIMTPPAGTAYPGTAATIPALFQIDAPPGAFPSRGLVRIGIDANRDRELFNEPFVDLRTDRQLDVAVAGFGPGGRVEIRTRISDFVLDLPLRGVRNQNVDLLARVTAGDNLEWSAPVGIVVDGEPPAVNQVLATETVTLGDPVVVSVQADDRGLSGVRSVEVMLDIARQGRFVDKPPPINAAATVTGQWTATLPTAGLQPGSYLILARATDTVGNISEIEQGRTQVITAEEAQQRRAALTTRVGGSVFYGGQPQPGMVVKMKPDQGAALPPVTTDQNGNFLFPRVAAGKYHVSAEGVVRNRIRKAATVIEVASPPIPISIPGMSLR